MVTEYRRDEAHDTAGLVAALRLLADHYEASGVDTPLIAATRMTVAQGVTGYAMAQLVKRLIDERHVRPESAAELTERAQHLQLGRGFFTAAELAQRDTAGHAAPPRTPRRARTESKALVTDDDPLFQ